MLDDLTSFKREIESSAAVENWVNSLQNIAIDSVAEKQTAFDGKSETAHSDREIEDYSASRNSRRKLSLAAFLVILLSLAIGLGFWYFFIRAAGGL